MSAEDEERFQSSNKCWICNKLFEIGHNKTRDNGHITGRQQVLLIKLTKNVPVIFHNLKGYDSHLVMQEIGKFDVKVNVIPNGLEKYMAFTINSNLVFIDSMQFINSSLDSLVKNCSDNDFKYFLQDEQLKLVKQKGVYPYEYMACFKKFFD